ncbi:hypothetical protein WMY93_029519 [Mugilogobius chulae]|uniref:Arf-GAP domain-containing protein n=1 Tax=Mugilogobius chulae TaxID=88201 RepID=A0AAW0MUS3_9GOBI
MAATAKRKQEEKHLKMLREMTSLSLNRKCFDCDQRGPTYANMTVGSFVCTSCSGILRGLNPPHRVKSISMTTFTQSEIEFLQKHGNESPVVSRGQPHPQQFHDKKFDLLSDLGGDIFAGPPNVNAGANSSFANFAHFNSHTTPQTSSANADFANFDTFGTTAASSGGFPSDPASFQATNTAFTMLSSSRSVGEFGTHLPLQAAHSSTSGGLGNANFANFDNFPKSCSADFGSFSSSSQTNSTGAGREATQSSAPADRYAALADLDNMFSSGKTEPGSGAPSGTSTAAAAAAAQVTQIPAAGGDRYAALAELNTAFSTSAPTSIYNTTSTSHGSVFAGESGAPSAQPQTIPTMAPGFGAQSTNPFVAAGVGPSAAPTNPFQSNGQAANVAATAASFSTASMSMPSGFGNAAGFSLPTSFSGSFQQQFPGQAPFPQPPTYPQQPNGGYPGFGQAKPVMTPFGQTMPGPMVSSNPFLVAGPSMQYPAGGSSTNPFL